MSHLRVVSQPIGKFRVFVLFDCGRVLTTARPLVYRYADRDKNWSLRLLFYVPYTVPSAAAATTFTSPIFRSHFGVSP